MIKNYWEKMRYLVQRQNSLCGICSEPMFTSEKIDLCHRVHRTKWRMKKYPLFIDSLLNLRAGHNRCNTTQLGALNMPDIYAEKCEAFLKRNKKTAEFVNGGKE